MPVLPHIFSKSSKKKAADGSASPTASSATPPSSPEKKSFAKSSKDRDRDRRSNSTHSSKTFSRSSTPRYDRDSHPLNLPPEELKRLSATMSVMSDQPTPMDIDREFTASPVPSSPANATPGAFPKNNASSPKNEEEESGPVPPPHRIPTSPPLQAQAPPAPQPPVDAESFKAAGNKFFKAKDYDKAIKEYTKGSYRTETFPAFCRYIRR